MEEGVGVEEGVAVVAVGHPCRYMLNPSTKLITANLNGFPGFIFFPQNNNTYNILLIP